MALQLIPKRRVLPNPSLVHLFSTAAEPDSEDHIGRSKSSFAAYFSDVKSSLQQNKQQQKSSSSSSPSSSLRRYPPSSPPRSEPSLDEVRKSLSLFRRRAADPSSPPDDSAPPPPPSQFRSSFNRSAFENGDGSAGRPSMASIRASLKNLRLQSAAAERQSAPLSEIRNSLLTEPPEGHSSPLSSTTAIGGREDLPAPVFGREMGERKEGDGATETEFVRMYSHEELGDKLRKLRPEGKKEKEGWFSIEELSGRLDKLRKLESKETDSRMSGAFGALKSCLVHLQHSEVEKEKKSSIESLGIMVQLGKTSRYLALPPKEHLLETYNHPDKMSAAEKMKIELTKVREEFKMSESDCGSTRVQVALLTTKIKYLSSILHKKDKHSRKGLVEMVHKRKRLLKYLRRTDWDSYCLVLDKLGLRDTPEYKTYDYKQ